MKKAAILAMCAAFGIGTACAESLLTAEVLTSKFWRGQLSNSSGVFQPGLEVRTSFGLSASALGNMDLTDKNDLRGRFNEVDLTLAYALPFRGPVVVKFGFVNYLFPYHSEQAEAAKKPREQTEIPIAPVPDTAEIFGSVAADVLLRPKLEIYRDIDEAKGWYIVAGVSHSYALTSKVALRGFASIGWGSDKYNEYYFGTENIRADKSDFNDVNVGLDASVEVVKDVTMSATCGYAALIGSDLKDAAKERYYDSKRLYGGLKLAYAF